MTTVKLELGDDIVASLRVEAQRTGRTLEQVASSRLRESAVGIFDELREKPGVDPETAMAVAVDEVRAVREEQRSGR